MSRTKKAILIFTVIIILACVVLIVFKAINPIYLLPQPKLGTGIYRLVGAYTDKGLTTFYGNGLIWSPNGKYIAGIVQKYGYPDFCFLCGSPHAEIFIIDVAKMEKQIILESNSDHPVNFDPPISWFPDSEHLSFMRGQYIDNNRKIWLTDLAGKDIHKFMNEVGDPVWSPDGSKVALLEKRNDSGNWMSFLYVLDLSTQEKRLIRESEGAGFFIDSVSWTPDGKNLIYIYGLTQDYDVVQAKILLFNIESGDLLQIMNDSYEYLGAEYSPVNSLIVLQRFDKSQPDFDHRYMTVIWDFLNKCEIVLPIPSASKSSWSPNGQKLVIRAGGDAYIVDLTKFIGDKFVQTGSICP